MNDLRQPPASTVPHRGIRLIATDIDGTLLDSHNQLPAANRAAVATALAHGVQLALVTARKQASTFAVAQLLGLPCACIAHNGARIWDWEHRELQHLVVDLELAREVAHFADRRQIPLIMTVNEVNFYSAYYRWHIPAGSADERRVAVSTDALLAAPTRLIVVGAAAVEAVYQVYGAAPESLVLHRYYSREGANVSAVLTHPRANKADAVATLARSIGVDAAEVLALGDAEADAGMLRWAGVGVAMGNAMPQARAAARWIAPSHDDMGLAAAVRRFVLMPHQVTEPGL